VKILILNGPNLARLDLREKSYYGNLDYKQLTDAITAKAGELGISIEIKQSDSESELISWIHDAADKKQPLIINPAAFTHYSYAIRDAISMLKAPAIEVHLSNPLSISCKRCSARNNRWVRRRKLHACVNRNAKPSSIAR
jgi:3-dehydroquinate dehydratase-2